MPSRVAHTRPAPHPLISEDLVRDLVSEQFPDLAGLPIGDRFDGADMAMFRLGDDLAVRLPRHVGSVGSLTPN